MIYIGYLLWKLNENSEFMNDVDIVKYDRN